MIKILTLAIVMFGLGYLYGANEKVRVETGKAFRKVVELIKRLISQIKGE